MKIGSYKANPLPGNKEWAGTLLQQDVDKLVKEANEGIHAEKTEAPFTWHPEVYQQLANTMWHNPLPKDLPAIRDPGKQFPAAVLIGLMARVKLLKLQLQGHDSLYEKKALLVTALSIAILFGDKGGLQEVADAFKAGNETSVVSRCEEFIELKFPSNFYAKK